MPKAALLMTVLLLSAVWVVAQTAGTQPSSPTGASPQAGQSQTTPPTPATQTGAATQPTAGPSQTIEGCLSGIPGQYNLTTKSGQIYSLSGDDSLLGNHVGEVVRATGAESSGGATPAASGNAATGGTAYGSTGTTGSQPGAATQSGQANTGAGAAANPATPAPAAGSGPRFQVSNLTKVSSGCKMTEPH